MAYAIETGTETEIIQYLEDRISDYNSFKLDIHDGRLFYKIIRNEHQEIIAGIGGWTWASVCEITQLWVSDAARNQGLGTLLLNAAEDEAKKRNCQEVFVRSFSFQAPHFYEKYGFKIVHVINDFPPGHSYYFLTKRIR